MGALITYFVTVKIERQKREYELKKEVYFDVLKVILDLREAYGDFNFAKEAKEASFVLNELAKKVKKKSID